MSAIYNDIRTTDANKVSMEKRLQLVKQIRTKYNEDQRDLTNRELILYGRSSRQTAKDFSEQESPSDETPVSFFRIRLILAVLLFVAVILMDMDDMEMAGITADKIFQAISADYEEVIDSWTRSLSTQDSL